MPGLKFFLCYICMLASYIGIAIDSRGRIVIWHFALYNGYGIANIARAIFNLIL